MDLLKDNVGKIFFKYLGATLGSSMIMSIYTIVDTVCIGKYEGADGTAAVACFFPMWSMIFAIGLWLGIGSSVIMAQKRGVGDKKEGDRFYSTGLVWALIMSAVLFIAYNLIQEPFLTMCGASGHILTLAKGYAFWISLSVPVFMISQYLVPLIRNDGSPLITTIATVAGGVFNVFGDIFFVFGCDMGISGAGLATALGQCVAFIILISYFFTKKCQLKITLKFNGFFQKTKRILTVGLSNFLIDIAMGVLTIIFNRQIVAFLGSAALGVYGVVSNIATIIQTLGYSIGESAQAVVSFNYGAGRHDRIKQVVKYAVLTSAVLGIICCLIGEFIPITLVRAYMNTTPEIESIAAPIMRVYFTAFIFLIFNVFSTYYFQSVDKPHISMIVSLMRGVVISGILLFVLPPIFGGDSIWFAVPIAEMSVSAFVAVNIRKTFKRKLKSQS